MAPVEHSVYGHIVLGMVSVVLYMAGLYTGNLPIGDASHSTVAFPLWAGVFIYMLTGVIGIRAKSMKVYAVMSIIAALCAFVQLVLESLIASCDFVGLGCVQLYNGYSCSTDLGRAVCENQTGLRACIGLAAAVGFLEMINAIFAAYVHFRGNSQTNVVV